jgi:hypothetical protein
MAIEIREDSLNSGSIQSGFGTPTHLAPIGTLFTDKSTGTIYINKNGSNFWVNISSSGSTGGGSISSFTYNQANNTFSIVESGVTYNAAINIMSGLTVNNTLATNTISATTYQNLPVDIFTGGTVTGDTIFQSGLTANTLSIVDSLIVLDASQLPSIVGVTIRPSAGGISSPGKTQILPDANGIYVMSVNNATAGDDGSVYVTLNNITDYNSVTNNSITFYGCDALVGQPSAGGSIELNSNGGLYSARLYSSKINTGNKDIEFPNYSGTLALSVNGYTANDTGDVSLPLNYLSLSGGTISGATRFISGLTANTIAVTSTFNSSGNTKLANSSGNKVLIGATPTIGSYSGGSIVDGLTINSDSGGISFLRPTDYAQMVALKVIDSSTLRVGGGNQNNIDIWGHTTAIARFSNGSGGRLGILTTSPQFTLDVSGDTRIVSGLTVTTISATTYQNLPTDIRTTGGTYSNNTFTFTNNTGGTYSILFNTLTGLTVNGVINITGNTSAQGLTATTISATTYQNLPTDIRTTGATYSNNTFTFNSNSGGTATTFSVLFNTVTGLTVNGNLTVTGITSLQTLTASTINVGNNSTVSGTTFLGNGTFTKAGYATGDVLLDNNGTDTPGVLFYYANNSNYGIDSWNGSYDVLSGQLLRVTNKLNESGGAVKLAIDTSGNIVASGFIKANAWRAGQVVNDIMLSNTEVTISTTTIATSNSDTDFLAYSYTPLSSSSYLVIHYHLASFSFEGGTGNDSYFSRIKVDGTEITYSRQSTVNGNRTGVLFPLTGRYTNSNTTAKSIVVACRRDSADDSITIVNSATSMWLRITEIAR